MPWDNGSGNNDKRYQNPKQNGPPDLDEVLKRIRHRLNRILDGYKQYSLNSFFNVGFFIVLVVVLWALSGIFIVSPAERAVILRFGKYVDTLEPGPHWIPRFIESNYIVNVQRVTPFSYEAQMLTKDENIVSISVAVQYRIDNAKDFLFNVIDPVESLHQAVAGAMQQVIGHTKLDDVLTIGREQVRQEVSEQLIDILKQYNMGLLVTDVVLQPAKPPEAITSAFDDAVKAREDEQRYINQARAYAEQVVSIARGQAQRLLKEADAYKQQVVLQADANTARYLALLPEYQRSPDVTRERLYLDAVESVLTNSSKVLVDIKGGNNMFYVPLDKIFDQYGHKQVSTDSSNTIKKTVVLPELETTQTPLIQRDVSRENYPVRGEY